MARSVTGDTPTSRFGYTAGGDAADLVLSADGRFLERVVPLPGGVVHTKEYGGATRWAYPNIHGDVIVTADGVGAGTSGVLLYGPHGQQIDSVTGDYVRADVLPTGGMDSGWLGQHQRPVENAAGLQAVEMGARVYLPNLGASYRSTPSKADRPTTTPRPTPSTSLTWMADKDSGPR